MSVQSDRERIELTIHQLRLAAFAESEHIRLTQRVVDLESKLNRYETHIRELRSWGDGFRRQVMISRVDEAELNHLRQAKGRLDERVEELDWHYHAKAELINDLSLQLMEAQATVNQLQLEITSRDATLRRIYASRTWTIVNKFRRLRRKCGRLFGRRFAEGCTTSEETC